MGMAAQVHVLPELEMIAVTRLLVHRLTHTDLQVGALRRVLRAEPEISGRTVDSVQGVRPPSIGS